MDLELRFPIVKLSRHYYRRRCMCPNCENRNNFKKFKLNEKVKCKSCGRSLELRFGPGKFPVMIAATYSAFSLLGKIENTFLLLGTWFLGFIILRRFILELQFLKIFATDQVDDLKRAKSNEHQEVKIQNTNKVVLSETKKNILLVATLIILIITWSVVSTHNVLEKEFDYTFSEF